MSEFKLEEGYKPKNFLDLYVPGEVNFKNSQAVIVPYGYEGTVTFGGGTKNGPKKLIEASWQVEFFDYELMDDIQTNIRIWTTKEPKIPQKPLQAANSLKKIISAIIKKDKFPVVVGGEHSISYGFAQALNEKYKDVSILVFDSHLDLKDRYSGKDFSHASWLKYSLDLPNIKSATLVGIRNSNIEEYKHWQENKSRINVFMAQDREKWNIKKIVDSLNQNVYLSFDIDVFDPSIMPSTGTPEPGGPNFDEILPIIREVARRKNIIGMDLVELAPIKGLHAPDFLAAKLLMKMLLYKFKIKDLKS